MKILLDTCVVLDALQGRKPLCMDAERIFLAVANHKVEGFLAASSATDIYYLLHKALHDDIKSRKIMDTLFQLFELLDTTGSDCRRAVLSEMRDYEDAVVSETALRSGMDYIVTRNIRDYTKSSIPALLPGELLERISEKRHEKEEGEEI